MLILYFNLLSSAIKILALSLSIVAFFLDIELLSSLTSVLSGRKSASLKSSSLIKKLSSESDNFILFASSAIDIDDDDSGDAIVSFSASSHIVDGCCYKDTLLLCKTIFLYYRRHICIYSRYANNRHYFEITDSVVEKM